ncbi:hypothetical protein F4808DRAFT_441346 [Astrocystis sublimbata]|nr:hypothetical protein F4808DRAFT_441346 [Astrocystis sublimbata]
MRKHINNHILARPFHASLGIFSRSEILEHSLPQSTSLHLRASQAVKSSKMHLSPLAKVVFAGLLGAGSSTALFSCNSDQHAFPPMKGMFVVHYTSIRDSHYKGQPWVRVCKPNADASGWIDVPALSTPCSNDPATILSTGQTGLHHNLGVTNGEGCDGHPGHGLNGASIAYNNQVAVLEGSNGRCGKRDKGVSCRFTLD